MARRPRKNRVEYTPAEKDAEDYLREARHVARKVFPYYSSPLSAMTLVIDDKVISGGTPTFAVDKYMRMYAHPEAIAQWMEDARNVTPEKPCELCGSTHHHELAYIAGAIIHEMWHPMRKHHERWKNIPNFQNSLGQIAADLELNDDIIASFNQARKDGDGDLCLPAWCLYPSKYEFEDDLMMEEYYQLLEEKQEEGAKMPDTSCGSGGGGQACEWEVGEPGDGDDDVPGVDGGEMDVMERRVAQEIAEAANKTPGKVPAGFVRWAEEVVAPSKYDWRRELTRRMMYSMNRFTQGYELTTYRRLSTMSAILEYNVILPTYQNPVPNVSMVYDTSGSVSDKGLKEAVEHGEAICKQMQATVNVVSCDTDISVDKAEGSMAGVQLEGGGGTDMTVGINKAMELDPKPDVVILFTDGFTPWPSEPLHRTSLIVCLVGEYVEDVKRIPDWAQVVRVEEENK